MKAVILAGGLGTRICEESHLCPKPMIKIGGKPILWHIMKIYSSHGINDFIICCGYKGYVIKEYFANYFLHNSDITFDLKSNKIEIHRKYSEPWKVTIIDTGESTQTGGRLKRVKDYLGNEDFCFTYGDGLANIDITKLISYHYNQKTLSTVTTVQPPGRWGALEIVNNKAVDFNEKPIGDGNWVNGGFFILSPKVLNYIDNDECIWEQAPMKKLANEGQISAFKHKGFWQPMDTLRDKNMLEALWSSNNAPWKIWQE